ncbi:MAG TPA: efflux RND transporter permease subunit [Gemmataceae bacterium]|nr:efflux RND transporter permease subunit [Gemmataceae bacterium]
MESLVVAQGAETRRTLGTAVFAGMIGVTLFGIFLTPVFFYVILRLSGPETAKGAAIAEVVPVTEGTPSSEAIRPARGA